MGPVSETLHKSGPSVISGEAPPGGGGSRSWRLASRSPQARQVKLAVLRVPPRRDARREERGDCAQPSNGGAGLIELTHMGVAGSEVAIRRREIRFVLDRQEELWYRLVEALPLEMRGSDHIVNEPDAASRCSIAPPDSPAINLRKPLMYQPRA